MKLALNFLQYHNEFFSGSNLEKDKAEIEEILTNWNFPRGSLIEVARSFARLMSALLNFDSEVEFKDRPAQIAILLILLESAEQHPKEAFDSFEGWHLNRDRTKLELRIRLASRLFFYGRRVLFTYGNTRDGYSALKRSVSLFKVRPDQLEKLNETQLSKFLGMRGTARLFLGRLQATSLTEWLATFEDLSRSYHLGNNGREATRSLREISLRILNHQKTLEDFKRFESVLDLEGNEDHQYFCDLALYRQYRAQFFALCSNFSQAQEECQSGIRACESALLKSTTKDEEAYVRNARGFLHQLKIQSCPDLNDTDELKLLDDIVEDLTFSYEFGFGGSALPLTLLRRSALLKKSEDFSLAISDLELANSRLDLVPSELQREDIGRKIEASRLEIVIRDAYEAGDICSFIDGSLELLTLGSSSRIFLFTISVRLFSLCRDRMPFDAVTSTHARRLRDKLNSIFLEASSLEEDESNIAKLRPAASYAASASRLLDLPQISMETVQLYEIALGNGENNGLELVAFAGNVALQYAKELASVGEADTASGYFQFAIDRLEEATRRFEAGEEFDIDALKPVVTYSKLGEAYFRYAKSTTTDVRFYRMALSNFLRARELGNTSGELSGLIGDVYYRIGFWGSDQNALEIALRMKEEAASAGNISRENFSVTARICEALHRTTTREIYIVQAVEKTLESIELDPSWPWPYFQLADLLQSRSGAFAVLAGIDQVRVPDTIKVLTMQNRDQLSTELQLTGVERVIENIEFRRLVLGGRSKVYVLDDPHRLLSMSIVVKPTSREDAIREIERTNAIRHALVELRLLDTFGVPDPIGFVALGSKKGVYALKRALGSTLAQRLLGSNRRGYPSDLSALRNTTRLLAIYHKVLQPPGSKNKMTGIRIAADLDNDLRRSGSGDKLSEDSFSLVADLFPQGVPSVLKKDAHAENWIVSNNGKIVLLDLEATSANPLLLDLAQLFEDFPAIPATNDGWEARRSILHSYWHTLRETEERPTFLEDLYQVMAIRRAVWGIGFCRGKIQPEESSTSRSAMTARLRHFESILAFSADGGGSGRLASVAQECLEKFGI